MNLKTLGILGLLVVLCLFMMVMTSKSGLPWEGTFVQPGNLENLIRRTAMFGVLSIGVSFVIISSGIDLSIGSIVCLSGCLLSLFLQVDYRPFDQRPIVAVDKESSSIVLSEGAESLEVGDVIRYYGGRRARTLVAKIVERRSGPIALVDGTPDPAAPIDGAETIEGTVLVLDAAPSNDDSLGFVAETWPIAEVLPGTSDGAARRSQVRPVGDVERLEPRDQLEMVAPDASGLKRQKIVARDGDLLELDDDVTRSVTAEWRAIPLERRQRMSIVGALLSVLGIAVALGIVHGLLVTRLQLQPFVVTLCGLLIYRGLSRWLVNDQPVGFGSEYESSLSLLGVGKLPLFGGFGIPYPFFVLLGIAIAAFVLLELTVWGRYLLALGRNEEAARYSGIDTRTITMAAYVISVVLAAIGGMLFALDTNSVSPSSFGNSFELYAIAAAVLGGCSLRGGEGSILGVVIGTAVMQVLNNMIVLLEISDTLEFAIIGSVILIGVLADESGRRFVAARRSRQSAVPS